MRMTSTTGSTMGLRHICVSSPWFVFVFHSYIYSTNIHLQIYYATYTNMGGTDNEKGPKRWQTVVWALFLRSHPHFTAQRSISVNMCQQNIHKTKNKNTNTYQGLVILVIHPSSSLSLSSIIIVDGLCDGGGCCATVVVLEGGGSDQVAVVVVVRHCC